MAGIDEEEEATFPSKKVLWVFMGIFLLLRLLFYVELRDTPVLLNHELSPETDSSWYITWADRLHEDPLDRAGNHPEFGWMASFGDRAFWTEVWGGWNIYHQSPLYVYLVAVVRLLDPRGIDFLVWLQFFFELAAALFVYLGARRVFDEKVALVAFGLLAVLGPNAFYAVMVQRTVLVLFFQAVVLYLFILGRVRWSGPVGFFFGVAFLLQPTFPVYLLFLLVMAWSYRRAAWYAGGFLLGLSPLLLRNLLVVAPLLSSSTRGKEALLLGHCVEAHPFQLHFPERYGDLLAEAGSAVGVWWASFRCGSPGEYLLFQGKKLLAMVQPMEIPNNFSLEFSSHFSTFLAFSLGYRTLFVLAFTGGLLRLPRWGRMDKEARRTFLRLGWWFGLTVVTLLVTTVLPRYRTPLVLPATILASYALVYLGREVLRRDVAGVARWGLAAALVAVPYLTLAGVLSPRVFRPNEYVLASARYLEQGRPEKAEEVLEAFARALRTHAPEDRTHAAVQALLRGQTMLALRRHEEAVKALAGILEHPVHGGSARFYSGLALHALRGKESKAIAMLRSALALLPEGLQRLEAEQLLSECKANRRLAEEKARRAKEDRSLAAFEAVQKAEGHPEKSLAEENPGGGEVSTRKPRATVPAPAEDQPEEELDYSLPE